MLKGKPRRIVAVVNYCPSFSGLLFWVAVKELNLNHHDGDI